MTLFILARHYLIKKIINSNINGDIKSADSQSLVIFRCMSVTATNTIRDIIVQLNDLEPLIHTLTETLL